LESNVKQILIDLDNKRAEKEAGEKLQQDLQHAEGLVLGGLATRTGPPEADNSAPAPATPSARPAGKGMSPLDTAILELLQGSGAKDSVSQKKLHSVSSDEAALLNFFTSHDYSYLATKANLEDPRVTELLKDVTLDVVISIFTQPGKDSDYFKNELKELGFTTTEARKLFMALRSINATI
jgi:hypothetical protein